MMDHKAILYISERANASNSVLAALKQTGYEVVTADSPTEGAALLYIMHSVGAVVLDNRAREQASFDVVQSLREIRPNVPLMLVCSEQSEGSPLWTDECMSTEELSSTLQQLLTAEAVL